MCDTKMSAFHPESLFFYIKAVLLFIKCTTKRISLYLYIYCTILCKSLKSSLLSLDLPYSPTSLKYFKVNLINIF